MEHFSTQFESADAHLSPPVVIQPEPEVITLEECKGYIGKYDLTDQRILEIRNTVIGIVDSALNSYVKNYGK